MLENGSEICSCKKTKCVRHGHCKECMEYHAEKNSLPRCKREKTGFWSRFSKKQKPLDMSSQDQ